MAEAAAGLGLISSFITIMRFLVDILKRIERNEEAKAVEKAAKAIETGGKISQSQAKETFARTLREELGEEKARPLIEYTEMVETFFPYRPSGSLLQYGTAIEQLVLQIRHVLKKVQAFGRFGQPIGSSHRLKFQQSGMAFANAIGMDKGLFPNPNEVYAFCAYLYERPIHETPGGLVAPSVPSMRDYFALLAEPLGLARSHTAAVGILVDPEESSPFSLVFFTEKADGRGGFLTDKMIVKRLESYEFKYCRQGLQEDTRIYLERVAREFEDSKEEARLFYRLMEALKQVGGTG